MRAVIPKDVRKESIFKVEADCGLEKMNADVFLHEEYSGVLAKTANREEILRCADQIPPLPSAMLKVLELLDDPNTDTCQLADAVCADTSLTITLLKLAHSPAYPQTQGILSIAEAITIIGSNQLRALVLTSSLIGFAKREAVDELVWENSVATAVLARRLAEDIACPQAEEVFLMGLLHCLGQFVFLANPQTRSAYAGVLRRIKEYGVDYITAELDEIGFSHNLIGALVANRWNLPSEICQVILHYPDPLEPVISSAGQKQALVKLADLLAHAAFIGRPPGYPIQIELIQQMASALGVNPRTDRGAVELIVMARNQLSIGGFWSA